jgi:ribose 5-phosphate isomerase B
MTLPQTIHLATDHGGFEHKEAVKKWLISEGFKIVDHGAITLEPLDDFPDYISKAAEAVSRDPVNSVAVVFGGSGQGEAMVANRYKKVRATVYYGGNKEIISLSKEHNDANILSIGARFVSIDETKGVIWQWLHTDLLPDEKYRRRNQKIEDITKEIYHL